VVVAVVLEVAVVPNLILKVVVELVVEEQVLLVV
jgi:hypothetical protein